MAHLVTMRHDGLNEAANKGVPTNEVKIVKGILI
jgi:hypothetical protein